MFQKATRKKVKLKLALTGPSGAGKTYSALVMAKGIGQKIAVIDTENASASLYADVAEFDTVTIDPPYTIAKYVGAIDAAVKAGYDVLVIDSITHAWAGDGGLLAKKEAMDVRGGNSFSNWGTITKEQESFKGKLLSADIHMVCTMRSKQDYVLEQNDKGKSTPRKVGLAPIQREGMEYEFTTVLDIAMDHNAAASKDRTGLFDAQIFKIDEKTGKTLKAWLDSGVDTPPKAQVAPEQGVKPQTQAQPAVDKKSPLKKNPGDFVITFGNHKGKKLSEISASDLQSYIDHLHNKAAMEGKTIQGVVKDFIDMAWKYIDSVSMHEDKDGIPL